MTAGKPEGEAAKGLRGRWAVALVVAVLSLTLPTTASAKKKPKGPTQEEKEEFQIFQHCPLTEATACVASITSGGEFIIATKTVPISKPILLQGGVAGNFWFKQPMIPAVGAETMQRVPEEVPGGLVGVGGLGGEVTATAEIAGPVSSVILSPYNLATLNGTAVTLPLKVHLSNELLGENCYIGSDEEPILLHLTSGKTSPPEGVEPISGSEEQPWATPAGISYVHKLVLVDNTFSVPGAQGCGNGLDSLVIDQLVDTDIGLPSAAGSNTVIMKGETKLAEVTAYERIQKEEQLEREKEEKKNKHREKKNKSVR